jgi:hypothetical protein
MTGSPTGARNKVMLAFNRLRGAVDLIVGEELPSEKYY